MITAKYCFIFCRVGFFSKSLHLFTRYNVILRIQTQKNTSYHFSYSLIRNCFLIGKSLLIGNIYICNSYISQNSFEWKINQIKLIYNVVFSKCHYTVFHEVCENSSCHDSELLLPDKCNTLVEAMTSLTIYLTLGFCLSYLNSMS